MRALGFFSVLFDVFSSLTDPIHVFRVHVSTLALALAQLFVADGAATALRRIDVSTSSSPQYAVVTVFATVTATLRPRFVTIDSLGLALYAAGADSAVRRVTLASGKTELLFGQAAVVGAADGVGSAATFSSTLAHLALDERNALYVADRGNAVRAVVCCIL